MVLMSNCAEASVVEKEMKTKNVGRNEITIGF
jgi:hypothetical protein